VAAWLTKLSDIAAGKRVSTCPSRYDSQRWGN
jgi:hypothetical protein